MSPAGAIFVPFPPKTGTNMLHHRPPLIVELVLSERFLSFRQNLSRFLHRVYISCAVYCAFSTLLHSPRSCPRVCSRSHPRPCSKFRYCSRFRPRSSLCPLLVLVNTSPPSFPSPPHSRPRFQLTFVRSPPLPIRVPAPSPSPSPFASPFLPSLSFPSPILPPAQFAPSRPPDPITPSV